MNDIQIVANVRPAEIESNLADLDAAIENQMKAYETLEVTEDNITERKSDVATLRKIKGAIEDRRKEIKRDYDGPLKEFESKVKVVTAKLDKQINRIDGDIKAFDKKRVEEKQAHIQAIYDQNIGEYAEYLPLSIIKSSKWDNKTCGDNEIISDIQTMVMKVRSGLEAIRALRSEIEDKLISIYKATGNSLNVAIQKNGDYIEAKKAAEESLRREKEEAKKAEEARKAEEAKREEERRIASEKAWDDKEQIPAEPVKKFDAMNEPVWSIEIIGADNIDYVRMFLEVKNIKYKEV